MSNTHDQQKDRAELIFRYIERATTADEDVQVTELLVSAPDFRDQFVAIAHLQGLIAEKFSPAQRRTSRPVSGRRIRRHGKAPIRWGTWLSVAACLAIIVGSLVYNEWRATQFVDVLVAHIQETAPAVRIIRRGETVFAVLDMPIYAGDRIVTGSGQGAKFIYEGEQTKVLIDQNTTLDIGSVENGKRLRLEKGVIDASVDPQPKNKPLIVTTRQAEAKVKGTTFRLRAKTGSTRIDVLDGQVRFTRTSDEQWVDVASGRYAIAAEGVELKAMSIKQKAKPPSKEVSRTVTAPDYVEGAVTTEEDFENGLNRWLIVVQDEKDKNILRPAEGAEKDAVRIIDVTRNGKTSKVIEIDGSVRDFRRRYVGILMQGTETPVGYCQLVEYDQYADPGSQPIKSPGGASQAIPPRTWVRISKRMYMAEIDGTPVMISEEWMDGRMIARSAIGQGVPGRCLQFQSQGLVIRVDNVVVKELVPVPDGPR